MDGGKEREHNAAGMPPQRKVAVLWLLLLGFFAVFNAVYHPIRQYQAQRAPENFEQYAERLIESGREELGRMRLKAGIGWFHPPYPGPYERLRALGDEAYAPGARLYGDLTQGGVTADTIASLREKYPPPHPRQPDLDPAIGLWREEHLLAPRNLELDPHGAAALLQAAHGRLSPGEIGATGQAAPVAIVAASGPRAVMMIDGVDYGGRARGLYAAILDAQTGRILQLGQFDLWESWDESLRMAKFLQRAPQGSIGVFAVSQDASVYFDYTHLAPELAYFGLKREAMVDGRLKFYGLRYRFAAIGVKGKNGGIQAWSPGEFAGRPGHPVCVAAWPENDDV